MGHNYSTQKMKTPITIKWLLAHGFSNQGYGKYQANYPCKVDSITIFLYNGFDSIDFWVEGDCVSINGTMREGTAEELQRYIDVCNLSDEFLDAYKLKKGDGEVKEYAFKSLPHLLELIEPTSMAKTYCQKLIDSLVKEGYFTDAKIVGKCLKRMNGEDVPMAIMDEKKGDNDVTK